MHACILFRKGLHYVWISVLFGKGLMDGYAFSSTRELWIDLRSLRQGTYGWIWVLFDKGAMDRLAFSSARDLRMDLRSLSSICVL